MSIALMSAAWKLPSKCPAEKLVLLAICDSANDEGVCWPSVATVARKCDVSERRVQQIFDSFEQRGVLKRSRRSRSDGSQASNYLTITLTISDSVGVKPIAPRGEAHCTPGVKPVSPLESSSESSQKQQQSKPAAAAPERKWKRPETPRPAVEWANRQVQAWCDHHNWAPPAADDLIAQAKFAMRIGNMDALGIERALKLAPPEIVVPCAILAGYEVSRMKGTLKNPGGVMAKRLREWIRECAA